MLQRINKSRNYFQVPFLSLFLSLSLSLILTPTHTHALAHTSPHSSSSSTTIPIFFSESVFFSLFSQFPFKNETPTFFGIKTQQIFFIVTSASYNFFPIIGHRRQKGGRTRDWTGSPIPNSDKRSKLIFHPNEDQPSSVDLSGAIFRMHRAVGGSWTEYLTTDETTRSFLNDRFLKQEKYQK